MIKMCKHGKTLIAFALALVMALSMAVPAFATGQVSNTGGGGSSGTGTYYDAGTLAAHKGYLYRNTSEGLINVPTDLAPTPLPEDLNLDPLAYWEQIIPIYSTRDDAGVEKTTRPTQEIYQEIRQLVGELTAGLTTDSDKFAALHMWVYRNISYNSKDNRTNDVYYIYERRYGACMEQSYLLYFMATLAGIKAAVLRGGTTVASGDMPVGTDHQSTAALDENGVWFGDTHSMAEGKPIADCARYADGRDQYYCNFETGKISKWGEIKGKRKPIDASSVNFIDVPEDAWYADAVKWAITWGVTNGTSENTFSPYKPCTNDEILTFLYRAADDYKFKGGSLSFTPKNSWATDALEWADSKGIIIYDYHEEDEDALCTRATAVYYIWKAFGKPPAFTDPHFTDMVDRDKYKGAVYWAVEEGIVQGTSETTFSPDVVCDRATIVTLLYRAYKDSMPLS